MSVPAQCSACGHRFEAANDLVGGITNCPSCGKAVTIEGLRDPFWSLLKWLGIAAWVVIVVWTYVDVGWGLALVFALIGGVLLGLLAAML